MFLDDWQGEFDTPTSFLIIDSDTNHSTSQPPWPVGAALPCSIKLPSPHSRSLGTPNPISSRSHNFPNIEPIDALFDPGCSLGSTEEIVLFKIWLICILGLTPSPKLKSNIVERARLPSIPHCIPQVYIEPPWPSGKACHSYCNDKITRSIRVGGISFEHTRRRKLDFLLSQHSHEWQDCWALLAHDYTPL